MTSVPRAFQRATVAAAEACFKSGASRRFLVADEVGLGKTTVAREIVRRLSHDGTKHLTVYYVTGNTRVSDQNATRLVDFLADEAKKAARSKADRLSMIPLFKPSDFPLRLYSLAPLTSFPPETTRPNTGSAVERAFLGLLLEAAVPGVLEALPNGFMQQRAKSGWTRACDAAARLFGKGDTKLIAAYRDALRGRFGYGLKRKIVASAVSDSPSRALTVLRRLLAEASLIGHPPDLIIFDEFQGFRHLLAPAAGDRLGQALLGTGRKKPAMLLLSATPYRLYGDAWDGKAGAQAHEELFDTIEFLTRDKVVRKRAEDLFSSFGEVLHAIGDAGEDDVDQHLAGRAVTIRQEIEALLRPHIARTERRPQSDAANRTHQTPLPVAVPDLRMFKHFATPLTDRNRSAASAYWLSVPLPAQALGERYKIVDKIDFRREPALPMLNANRRLGEGQDGWGNPKLRALQAINGASDLALPWVAPSLPWWTPAGPWEGSPSPKTLLFSRFRATPQSVAALMSLGVEDAYLDKAGAARRKGWDGKRLQPKSGLPVMGLFHPSPFLIRETDPLAGGHATPALALRTVSAQIRAALHKLCITVRSKPKKDAERAQAAWSLLASIERRSGDFTNSQAAWEQASDDESVLGKIVGDRHTFEPIDWISARELRRLAELALAGPAVVVGRAVRRHFPDAIASDHLPTLVGFCWHRLRTYLDKSVFWQRLGRGNPTEILLEAVKQGGLESVLDEHFWLALGQTKPAQLIEELGSALHPSLGSFTFKSLPTGSAPIRLRCHAAVPFSGSDSADSETTVRALIDDGTDRPPRAEGLRRAFNTPFWPHILATTSVGQEGLDFHSWCRRIVHWDLPSNPVDLEQREGRISRYGGLLVRRPLGKDHKSQALLAATESKRSPWIEVARLAEADRGDAKGLAPWWACKGASVSRHVLALTKSRDLARFDHLQRQRLLYRLALGQPNQEDLVNHLARGSDHKIAQLSRLAIDLSPTPVD